MQARRDWFWQLQATGQGPDWWISVNFTPTNAQYLALLIRQHPLPGFAYYHADDGVCCQHQYHRSYDLYIDQRNYAQMVVNLTSGQTRNIWIYHTIEVCNHSLTIERGYGGYPGFDAASENTLLVMLAQTPKLCWEKWEVSYGGGGYPTGHLAGGTTAAAFLAYLSDS